MNRIRELEPGATGRDLRILLAGPLASPAEGRVADGPHDARRAVPGLATQVRGNALPVIQVKDEVPSRRRPGQDVMNTPRAGRVSREVGRRADLHGSITAREGNNTLKFSRTCRSRNCEETLAEVDTRSSGSAGEPANISPASSSTTRSKASAHALSRRGLALKTYMNLKANRHETRLVLDLDLQRIRAAGVVEEFAHRTSTRRRTSGSAKASPRGAGGGALARVPARRSVDRADLAGGG